MANATIAKAINELNDLVKQGKFLEAFELYYDDNVVMQENELPPTIGKEANRTREEDFFSKVTGFAENAKVEGIAAGDDITTVIWHYNYHHKEWGSKNYKQVSVQHWKNGKIVKEQFFYGS